METIQKTYIPLWDDLIAAAREKASYDEDMLHLVEQLITRRDVHLGNEKYMYELYCKKLNEVKKLKKQIKNLKSKQA